ncbi:peptide/nickel transport system permease protein [Halanaerobium saccharolyticum]|uniref:Peptide/nickel transport system permease protein n=1 Tax=Halanaerobium saccharolyticum TaxID=43595 RepID=A0A4R6M1N8_9FIRM|nr:ABC transporter permease [Halanaerobium saccharolyticum]TDO95148.1 peptide/nickel transport system permease protein [Halanaerobium saccharolyticum]
MASFILKRMLNVIPLLILITIISFAIIQLPPGDFISSYIARLQQMGEMVGPEQAEQLRDRYGLDQPIYVQYFKWMSGVLRGDFGYSFDWQQPVSKVIGERLALTLVLTLSTTLFVWIVGFLIGLYSATHQYSIGDYIVTFFGFIGLATPNFMLALILMWIAYAYFGQNVGGLFSPEFLSAPWSIARVIDMLKHLWIPVIITGTAGTAGLIRIFRANLLDELGKPYVATARAKGLSEFKLIFKYPVRIALIPFVATVGWTLPKLISSATITSVVLSLPTAGPVLLKALQNQDMFLAGSFILLLSVLTVVGTLISDILLAWVDPRISYN